MSTHRIIAWELTRIEAAHLAAITRQFVELLPDVDGTTPPADPAVARLVPDVYPDDPDASTEYRRLTAGDLLDRRRSDAQVLLQTLSPSGEEEDPGAVDEAQAMDPVLIAIDRDAAAAWMRTLAAVRLVLAERLGIRTDDDHATDDPQFFLYDWLGYRLDALVQVVAEE